MKNYYCSQKFNWAQITLFDGRVQSCCQAVEDAPSLDEIKSHPVGFFNYQQIVKDRTDMLNGEKISGCQTCWNDEDRGLVSRRNKRGSSVFINNVDQCVPTELSISLSNTCAMTCVYCCKKYSHSWRADVINNGPYDYAVDDRYTATNKDQLFHVLSQSQIQQTKFYHAILDQLIKISKSVDKVSILGGEPFLSNNLMEMLDVFDHTSTSISITTGLGVAGSRLEKIVKHIAKFKNLSISVSAESIGNHYEFIRYGNTFDNFNNNIKILQNNGIPIKYGSTVNNLSIFNFLDFVDTYVDKSQCNLTVDLVSTPFFLSPHVLDDTSKQQFLNRCDQYSQYFDVENLKKSLAICPSDTDRVACKNFLTEFSKRRNLSLDIFPKSFVSWLTK